MIRYLFFLIIPFLLIPFTYGELPSAYAEVGSNYDNVANGDGTFTWSTHPERINENGQWVNYLFDETQDHIQFESAATTFKFDKNDCTFSLYEPGEIGSKAAVTTVSHALSINDIEIPLSACIIQTSSQNEDGIFIEAKRGVFTTEYDISYTGITKWTHTARNQGVAADMKVTDTCIDCIPTAPELFPSNDFGEDIILPHYILNSKNDIHGFLVDQRFEGRNIIMEFESSIGQNEDFVIDPTFVPSIGFDGNVFDRDNDDVCEDVGSGLYQVLGSFLYSWTYNTASTTDCGRSWIEFDTSSWDASWTVDSATFEVEVGQVGVGGGAHDKHDLYLITSQQPTTRTLAQQFDEIDNDTLCTDNKVITTTGQQTYTITCLADLKTQLDLKTWTALGTRIDDETLEPVTGAGIVYDSEAEAVPPILTVTYSIGAVWSPGPPINPAATTTFDNLINFTWTPANATGVTGYAVWNSTTNAEPWTNVANTGNFTGSTGFYTALDIRNCYSTYWKASAFSVNNNGTNSTTIQGYSVDCGPPDAIDDLTSVAINAESVDLDWSAPNPNNGTISGYMINFTTPFGTPTTVIDPDTGSTDTESTVSGLSELTDYTFRVSAITPGGKNDTGNKLNVTTIEGFTPEVQGNFSLGTSDVNQTNPDIIDIRFVETEINSTTTELDVIFLNTYDLACNMHYKFAQTNNTFTGMAETIFDSSHDEVTFAFNDHENEIIDVTCYDQTGSASADHLITQSSFPLVSQIQAFQAGAFGTSGDIGVLDFVTVGVILISMVGFNRRNESVGIIFSIGIVGVASIFGLIQWYTTWTAALIIIGVVTFVSTRKQ